MQKLFVFGVLLGAIIWGCHPGDTQSEASKKTAVNKKDTVVTHTFDSFGLKIDSVEVQEHTIKRNESLYTILDSYNFSPQEIYGVTEQAQKFIDFDDFKPGQTYRTYSYPDNANSITKMVWQPNPVDYVVFNWQDDSLAIYEATRPVTNTTTSVSGTIDNSLYQTINNNDASPLLAYKLAEIFAWQINFFGLREGDSFNVLYNKQFVNNEYYGIGEVLAAEFTHRGETYRAYKFNEAETDGYFTETGKSVQKALLKAPFKFSQRISSHFSHSRYHPILKKRMPHYGVDYAAPYGTPVLSVGDGTVTEAQYRGANGNIIKITHNGTYRTAYLHLKGFANGIHPGADVEQGQVIGYVGNTGRSTGTHLDYRLYRNNRPVNPLTVELPSSDSVPDSLMREFKQVRDSLNRQLFANPDTTSSKDPVLTQAK